jgi:hypothetical protein
MTAHCKSDLILPIKAAAHLAPLTHFHADLGSLKHQQTLGGLAGC